MKIVSVLLGLLSVCTGAQAFPPSPGIRIYVIPIFGTSVLQLADSAFQTNDSSNTQIAVLKFYISKIQLARKGKIVLEEQNSFHLVDASEIKSFQFSIDNKENIAFDELKFNLGIDSATNVSGALGGDLDPTKGMYWTWQSGYINFKLEGKSDVCKTRNNEFTFHLGGYQEPNSCLQTLSFKIKNPEVINLKLDVKEILKQIDWVRQNQVMSPGMEAVLLSKIVGDSFKITEN